ncbi:MULTISPECIES: thioesterase family protein [Shewanella]|jgi:acyl-CoA thioester hydrolase|uniref:Thioesterase superfamily protein n=2 Tax=Shewanella TaxID=22 RepID=Q07W21_SHEFN|nr:MULTISPECIES: thioesterase family protein [Shewanella]ABI73793.1 thioesterase superfamily protein [Shewanella frigidimarina NCIMB 400]AZG71394.1 acyl-CoA thioesterase [Shewanella livingstonensis]MBB1363478.1 acyl-CoA thioesterase [Shewanella sp. SR44-4]MBB1425185.1 acyl-CoA thioesterase [Shewanella sp. SG44-2]PKI06773.1 acyl-CoA thioesterase [Shewanella sp. 11B5]|tara:strand:+ start:2794 stop:3216 length:423 start_codon:yes stop_codon:yes gene_type:complete
MNDFLAQHSISTDIQVAWGEMDALQHVNNSVYFKYFETARLDFFNQINLLDDLKTTGVGPVLSETNARFKRPVTFPDSIVVGVKISDINEDRFVMHYTVFSKAQQAVTTIGWAKVVMFNFKTGKKAKLTPELLSALLEHE